jgi:hypothetical protein
LVTAGWEEDEAQDQEIHEAVPNRIFNLNLFQRTESLFAEEPEIIRLLQERQDKLRHLRDVYRMRLGLAIKAAQETRATESELVRFDVECESSLEMIRQIDRQYYLRTTQICDEYEMRLQLDRRARVMRHRTELQVLLDGVEALLIAGGHAAIILNRLRIFALLELNLHLPVIAWSGGAMALADQIVFYHDFLPQGDSNPEVLRAGMGCLEHLLPLPDARNRLRLDDRRQMSMFAERFSNYDCVLFDEHCWVESHGGRWQASRDTQRLERSGQLTRYTA